MLFIDCVDSLEADTYSVSKLLQNLSRRNDIESVIFGTHQLRSLLERISMAVIRVQNLQEFERNRCKFEYLIEEGDNDAFLVRPTDNTAGVHSTMLKLLLKKLKSGKIFEEAALFKSEQHCYSIEPAPSNSKEAESCNDKPLDETSMIDGVTFSLGVNAQQRDSRAEVKLPFMAAQELKKAPTIVYMPDQADDYDDEDPDADLEF